MLQIVIVATTIEQCQPVIILSILLKSTINSVVSVGFSHKPLAVVPPAPQKSINLTGATSNHSLFQSFQYFPAVVAFFFL